MKDLDYILLGVGEPAALEQLAEECSELAKAALKKARILRRENPTPVSIEEANLDLIEEFNDVYLCAGVVDLEPNYNYIDKKLNRWKRRLEYSRKKHALL